MSQKYEISKIIDEPYFSRGKEFLTKKMIYILSIDEKEIYTKTFGSQLYTTHIYLEYEKINGYCSCPAYESFGPCKHMAAVGILWKQELKDQNNYQPSDEMEEVINYYEKMKEELNLLTKEDLVQKVIDISFNDNFY